MTYLEFMKQKENEALENNKEESAVVLLLEHICGLETNALFMKRGDEIEEKYVNSFNEIFDKYLHENQPIQYLIGTSCFYGYDFIVNENVLIPRFETEELVENILYKYDEHFGGKKVEVCDLATGSGCIAITLALEEPNMHVVASDISKEALEVAKKNNEKLGANVKFLQGDMLAPLKGNEPNLALFGGDDGMKFYRIILQGLRPLLNKKALVAFEHGYDKKEEMLALCKKYFPECKAECIKDLEGKDRMTFIYVGDFKWQEE